MATVSVPVNQTYSSGNVAIALNAGDFIAICAFWQWVGDAGYEISSGTISVGGTGLAGYFQQVKTLDSVDGCYMGMSTYIAPSTASYNISLSPTDPGAGRTIRLQVIKIVPSSGLQFTTGYVIDDAKQSRFTGAGDGTITTTNQPGDFLIGMCHGQTTSSTLRISWYSPAAEQTDVYDLWESSTGVQVSEEADDTLLWNISVGAYSGGLGIVVRETNTSSLLSAIWESY